MSLNSLNNLLTKNIIKARLRSVGLSKEDLNKPKIAIINSYNDLLLPHKNFREWSQSVKEEIRSYGGIGIECNTIAVCDGIAHGTFNQKYVLPSRDIIADSIEVFINAHGIFDGMICIGACDKVVPAMLLAAVRVNLPTIIIPGAPQDPFYIEHLNGKIYEKLKNKDKIDKKLLVNERYIKGLLLDGVITEDEFVEMYKNTISSCGVCRFYATPGSMVCFTEALGMMLSGASYYPDNIIEKKECIKLAGKKIIELVKKNIKPSDIINRASITNAVRTIIAMAGSMNAIMHSLSLANEAGIELSLEDIGKISDTTPFILNLQRYHPYEMIELLKAGGVLGVMKNLQDLIDGECLTVHNKRIKELLSTVEYVDHRVIKTKQNAYSQTGGIVVLKGNLAPNGSIIKMNNSQRIQSNKVFRRMAVVFDSQEDFFDFISDKKNLKKIGSDSVIIIRYEGPKGGPGMREAHRGSEIINHFNLLGKDYILITDGRYSGASHGFIIGYVSPEAAEGGLIAYVKKNDEIEISFEKNEINLLVSRTEIEKRRGEMKIREKAVDKNAKYLRKYQKLTAGTKFGAACNLP